MQLRTKDESICPLNLTPYHLPLNPYLLQIINQFQTIPTNTYVKNLQKVSCVIPDSVVSGDLSACTAAGNNGGGFR